MKIVTKETYILDFLIENDKLVQFFSKYPSKLFFFFLEILSPKDPPLFEKTIPLPFQWDLLTVFHMCIYGPMS